MSIKPNTQYTWDPEVTMTITGKEFDILYNSLMGFMSSSLSPTSFLAVADAAAISRLVLERAITEGKAVEEMSHTVTNEDSEDKPGNEAEGLNVGDEVTIPVSETIIVDFKPEYND